MEFSKDIYHKDIDIWELLVAVAEINVNRDSLDEYLHIHNYSYLFVYVCVKYNPR